MPERALVVTQYDLSATTYSPDGKVFQTDYAQKAVDNSGYAIQICSAVYAVAVPQMFKVT